MITPKFIFGDHCAFKYGFNWHDEYLKTIEQRSLRSFEKIVWKRL